MNLYLNVKQKFITVCGLMVTILTLLLINSLLVMPVMVPVATTIKRLILRVI